MKIRKNSPNYHRNLILDNKKVFPDHPPGRSFKKTRRLEPIRYNSCKRSNLEGEADYEESLKLKSPLAAVAESSRKVLPLKKKLPDTEHLKRMRALIVEAH